MNATVLDTQVLQDAHDAAMKCIATLEQGDRSRTAIDNAQRWASLANAKLVEAQCQMSGQGRKGK
jgi:hypothetical protein